MRLLHGLLLLLLLLLLLMGKLFLTVKNFYGEAIVSKNGLRKEREKRKRRRRTNYTVPLTKTRSAAEPEWNLKLIK